MSECSCSAFSPLFFLFYLSDGPAANELTGCQRLSPKGRVRAIGSVGDVYLAIVLFLLEIAMAHRRSWWYS